MTPPIQIETDVPRCGREMWNGPRPIERFVCYLPVGHTGDHEGRNRDGAQMCWPEAASARRVGVA